MNKKILISIIVIGILLFSIGGFTLLTKTPIAPKLTGVKALASTPKIAILVPGHGGNKQALAEFSNYLESNNWETHILDIGTGTDDLNIYANNLKQKISEYNEQNKSVNIIGYSAGGIITRLALSDETVAAKTARVLTIASPHLGTKVADLGQKFNVSSCGVACSQLSTDSDLIKNLPQPQEETNWLTIFVDNDEAIRPDTNAKLNGSTNINISQKCTTKTFTHGSVIKEKVIFSAAESFFYTGEYPQMFC